MNHNKNARQVVRELCRQQQLAVLATSGNDGPYGSVVAFAVTDDLKTIVFATPRASRKYANMQCEPRGAMVIDDRKHHTADFQQAAAATAVGTVAEVKDKNGDQRVAMFLEKHPTLRAFVTGNECAVMVMTVECYTVVRHFQQVEKLRL